MEEAKANSNSTLDLLGGGDGVGSKKPQEVEEKPVQIFDESDNIIDLGLGLGLGLGLSVADHHHAFNSKPRKNLATEVSSFHSSPSSSSSSSSWTSSSPLTIKANSSSGTKRIADHSVSPPSNRAASNQVAGWPPIGTHRMNSLVIQGRTPPTAVVRSMNPVTVQQEQTKKTLMFVKAYMDGDPIGRKLNLNNHICYETLAQMLEHMFFKSSNDANILRFLNESSSEFLLAYEDKDGDCMKVGDVPWDMFIGSVKRLRIMRKSGGSRLAFN